MPLEWDRLSDARKRPPGYNWRRKRKGKKLDLDPEKIQKELNHIQFCTGLKLGQRTKRGVVIGLRKSKGVWLALVKLYEGGEREYEAKKVQLLRI